MRNTFKPTFVWGIYLYDPTPVAVQSRARIYGRSHAGIASSNPVGDMDVFLLRSLSVSATGR